MLPILIAVVLDRFTELMTELATRLGGPTRWSWRGTLLGIAFAAGIQNWQMYINGYLNRHPNTVVTGQAMFVQQKGLHYHYYDLGNPLIYWGHGDNRFINHSADGIDVINPSNFFPVLDNGPTGEKDALFMVWQPMHDYLGVLRAYYAEGHVEYLRLGDPAYQTDPIIDPGPHEQPGSVDLTAGDHTVTVSYRYDGGVGFLECWWTPPGRSRSFLVTPALRPPAAGATAPKPGAPIPILATTPPPIPESPAAPHGR